MSAMKLVLWAALTVKSKPKVGLSTMRRLASASMPRFTTAPRFSNRLIGPPADGGSCLAMSALDVRLL